MNNSILHNPNYALHYRLIDDDVRHITPEEASFAWSNQMFRRPRPRVDPLEIAALGHDSHGTMIEMVAYDAGAYADRNGNPQNWPKDKPMEPWFRKLLDEHPEWICREPEQDQEQEQG